MKNNPTPQVPEAHMYPYEAFRAMVEVSPEAVFFECEGKIVFANPAALALFGAIEPSQLLGQLIMERIAPASRDLVASRFAALNSGQKTLPLAEEQFLRLDGKSVNVEVVSARVTYEGKPTTAVLARDVTARQQSEEKIRDQAALLNITQDAILVCDLDGTIQFWNDGATRLYGITCESALGKKCEHLIFKIPATQFTQARQRVLEQGTWSGPLLQVTHQGRDIFVQSRWTLVRDAQGNPKSILAVNTDITQQKRLEAQHLVGQRMEIVSALASGIAHDLNNVLSPILMSVQYLREVVTNEDDRDMLSTLDSSARRGTELIKQLLSFGRGTTTEPGILQPKHLLREIANIVNETFPKNIKLQLDYPRDSWVVMGDASQLHQTILNLCINAKEAMPTGGLLKITLSNVSLDECYVQMTPQAKAGPYVAICVEDAGRGIPSEIQDRVFDPFFTTKAPGLGTGLGLSTAANIVKNHGGFMRVNSILNKGSQFTVYLPASVAEPSPTGPITQPVCPRGNGELVLLIDDEPAICQVAKRTLEAAGYRVLTAHRGAEAVALYVKNRQEIKLVILDMLMPDLDGQATIRVLQSINPHVRIIAVSGVPHGTEAHLDGLQVQAVLDKPFTGYKLLESIKQVCDPPSKTLGLD